MTEKETRVPVRWDPFEELDQLMAWGPSGRGSRLARWLGSRGSLAPFQGGLAPAMDISENDECYVVTVEVPGSKKEDVTVEIQDNVLTIRGEKRNEREGKKEQCRWVERSYGSFSRSFTLPSNAAGDRVRARFEEGVLTVEVPKAEEAKPKVISIK